MHSSLNIFIMIFLSKFILFYNCGFFKALGACGLAPNYTMNSGRAEAKALSNDLSFQALHLVEVQDPVNCVFV